ncbi:hypothetical protein L3Q82_026159 [Scortum barcoo]|uniref:Uncharacterized protein n=1 Tax=Scortum barcoo TaxID=214431 RepID=A0ACB8WHM9_9TELE|nr:hypothetical protein L3Q82_026159 [Scortum barcoo]
MIYFLLFCSLTGLCLGVEVRQSVSDLVKKTGDKVQISCSHDKTDYTGKYLQINSYAGGNIFLHNLITVQMFYFFFLSIQVYVWVLSSPPGDTAMKLIGFLNFQAVTMEDQYKEQFNISGDLGGTHKKNGSLVIKRVEQKHSAVYYCAASKAH